MQLMFNRLDGLYLCEKCILIDTSMKYQFRKESAAKIEKLNREKKVQKQKKGRYILSFSKKILFF